MNNYNTFNLFNIFLKKYKQILTFDDAADRIHINQSDKKSILTNEILEKLKIGLKNT